MSKRILRSVGMHDTVCEFIILRVICTWSNNMRHSEIIIIIQGKTINKCLIIISSLKHMKN